MWLKNNQLFYWKQSGLTGVLGDPCDFVNFLNSLIKIIE
jgi:hypothetical protein